MDGTTSRNLSLEKGIRLKEELSGMGTQVYCEAGSCMYSWSALSWPLPLPLSLSLSLTLPLPLPFATMVLLGSRMGWVMVLDARILQEGWNFCWVFGGLRDGDVVILANGDGDRAWMDGTASRARMVIVTVMRRTKHFVGGSILRRSSSSAEDDGDGI
jgi:hypothetical protein